MPLKAAVTSLDQVDEGLRPLYRQQGEGDTQFFVLDVEPSLGWNNEHIEGLKTTLGKLRKEKGDLEQSLRSYDGLDAQAARDAMKKVEEFASIDPKKEADRLAEAKVNERLSQVKGLHQQEVEKLKRTGDLYKGNLVKLMIDREIDSALDGLESKGHAIQHGMRDDLRIILRQYVSHEFDDERGSLKVNVHDGTGVPRVKNTAGDYMTIADLVAELPASKPVFFAPKNQPGAGTKSGSGGGMPGAGATKKRSEMSLQERAKFVAEHGQDAYLKLPA